MKRFLLLAALCAAAGCAPSPADRGAPAAETASAAAAPADPVLPAPADDAAALARGSNAFGLDLYGRLSAGADAGNVFVSPTSIVTAFGMVQAGARGATADAIARTLHTPLPPERLHPAAETLLDRLRVAEPGRTLTIANALWLREGFPIRADYRQTLAAHYGAPPRRLDFDAPAAAAATINRWAADNTNGRIQGLVPAAAIKPITRLILTNAVWFKGDWRSPFHPGDTSPLPFHGSTGTTDVPTMRTTAAFRHLDGGTFQAIELPYRGEELAMTIFLPEARNGLAAFEASLTPARLEDWLARLHAAEPVRAEVAIPQLKLEARYELGPALSAMGMALAFSDDADLSGISDAERLAVDQVIHQTFLAVDEEGTEAAAATAITIRTVSMPAPPQVRFHADRPFLFLIRDHRTGAIVFIGRITTPRA